MSKPSISDLKKTIAKDITHEGKFHPNDFQERVKARFYRRIEEQSHRIDRESVFESEELMTEMAGTPRVMKWIQDPRFTRWFLDEEYTRDSIMSLQNKAISTINGILDDEGTYASDKLKAARMLLELGEQFPNKKEIRFIDDTLNNMSENEVSDEAKKIRAKLAQLGK